MALTRRAALFGAGAAVGIAATRWVGPSNSSLDGVAVITSLGGETTLNDASLLSETSIFRHIRSDILHQYPWRQTALSTSSPPPRRSSPAAIRD